MEAAQGSCVAKLLRKGVPDKAVPQRIVERQIRAPYVTSVSEMHWLSMMIFCVMDPYPPLRKSGAHGGAGDALGELFGKLLKPQ